MNKMYFGLSVAFVVAFAATLMGLSGTGSHASNPSPALSVATATETTPATKPPRQSDQIQELKSQIRTLKNENHSLSNGLDQVIAAAIKIDAGTNASAESSGAGKPAAFASAMAKVANVAIQQKLQSELAALKSRLNLTDAQEAAVKKLLEEQYKLAGDVVGKLFEGKLSAEEMQNQSAPVDLDGQLKQILSPQQWAGYQQYQTEQNQATAQMAANGEVMMLQTTLQLSPQQRDQVYNTLYQQNLDHTADTSGAGLKVNSTGVLDWEQQMEAKKAALKPILNDQQMQGYEKMLQSQHEMVKAMMPGLAAKTGK